MQPMTTTLVLTGRPGSGKGTQAKTLAKTLGLLHFSTGDRFKALRDGEGALAALVRSAFDSGKLLPDWFATYLFEDAVLNMSADSGIVFDGYPRSLVQAEIFHETMQWLGRSYIVLDLCVPADEVMKRMLSRAEVEHRPDSSTEEQIHSRLATYEEHTAPVLEYFREKGMLKVLDGTGTREEVAAAIEAALANPA